MTSCAVTKTLDRIREAGIRLVFLGLRLLRSGIFGAAPPIVKIW